MLPHPTLTAPRIRRARRIAATILAVLAAIVAAPFVLVTIFARASDARG